jgi:hypothetical protein
MGGATTKSCQNDPACPTSPPPLAVHLRDGQGARSALRERAGSGRCPRAAAQAHHSCAGSAPRREQHRAFHRGHVGDESHWNIGAALAGTAQDRRGGGRPGGRDGIHRSAVDVATKRSRRRPNRGRGCRAPRGPRGVCGERVSRAAGVARSVAAARATVVPPRAITSVIAARASARPDASTPVPTATSRADQKCLAGENPFR